MWALHTGPGSPQHEGDMNGAGARSPHARPFLLAFSMGPGAAGTEQTSPGAAAKQASLLRTPRCLPVVT